MKIRKRLLVLAALNCLMVLNGQLASGSADTTQPGFDCSKASGSVEELICRDSSLARLDLLLKALYQRALENLPEDRRSPLTAMQRGWIKGRNDCWKAENMAPCVQSSYEIRITELQIHTGVFIAPEPVDFACDNDDFLTAVFYSETILPSVVLTRTPGAQSIAFLSPSGSGARYEGRNVTFWTQGQEAMVEWEEIGMTCQVLEK